jgi:hypothetical protein
MHSTNILLQIVTIDVLYLLNNLHDVFVLKWFIIRSSMRHLIIICILFTIFLQRRNCMDLFQTPHFAILPPASWKIIMPSSSFHIEPPATVVIAQISFSITQRIVCTVLDWS